MPAPLLGVRECVLVLTWQNEHQRVLQSAGSVRGFKVLK